MYNANLLEEFVHKAIVVIRNANGSNIRPIINIFISLFLQDTKVFKQSYDMLKARIIHIVDLLTNFHALTYRSKLSKSILGHYCYYQQRLATTNTVNDQFVHLFHFCNNQYVYKFKAINKKPWSS